MTLLRAIFGFFSSLKLTVILLSLGLVLIFFGTLDQVNFGIRHTQDLYFESWFVLVPVYQLLSFQPRVAMPDWLVLVTSLPMPGGFSLGTLFLLNLACAHFRYFRLQLRKFGIVCIHGGLILLIVAGFLASVQQREGRMVIPEGGSANYSEDFHQHELALIRHGTDGTDQVISIPFERLVTGQPFADPGVPFDLFVHVAYENATVTAPGQLQRFGLPADVLAVGRGQEVQARRSQLPAVLRGVGAQEGVAVFAQAYDYSQDERNIPTAILSIFTPDRQPIGSFLVSSVFDDRQASQVFQYDGETWEVALRFRRYYKPYDFALLDFRNDYYPGTDIPRHFSSQIRILNAETGEDREALISMNRPLRYDGLTFYQYQFQQMPAETRTVLMVVRNPGWTLPYIGVALVGLGLCIQFGIHFVGFLKRRGSRKQKAADATAPVAPETEASHV